MKNNRINILAKLGSLVGLGALAIAPIAMIGTLSETQVIDSNIVTDVQDDAVSVTSVNGDNGEGETFELDNTSGSGTLKYTILTEDVGTKTGTVSVSKGITEPTGALDIPNIVINNNISYTVTFVAIDAFRYCSELTTVTMGAGVKTIGDYAFEYCYGLTSVVIGGGVTSIADDSFAECPLTSITLAEGNTTFSMATDVGDADVLLKNEVGKTNGVLNPTCSNVVGSLACGELVIPNSVTSIATSAFFKCSGLTSVTIGSEVKIIAYWAFAGCPLTSISVAEGNTTFSMATNVGDSMIVVNKISGILNNTCSNVVGSLACGDLVIPNTVTLIIGKAFYGCSGLTSVEISNSATSINNNSFSHCSGLTSVTIPDSVTLIGNYAFEYCSGLTTVNMGSGVTAIGFSAFTGCTGLADITIMSANPPTLGANEFIDTRADLKIYVPNSSVAAYKVATNWSTYTDIIFAIPDVGVSFEYSNSTGLGTLKYTILINPIDSNPGSVSIEQGDIMPTGELNIPNDVTYANNTYTVTSISVEAFYNCSGLTSVTIGSGVTSIGNKAFSDCSGLIGELIIPNSVNIIEENAFNRCFGLTSVEIGSEVTSIGKSAFESCTGLTSLTIRAKSINDSAFKGCTGLTSLEIGSEVTSIGKSAFESCSGLTSVTIRAKSISENAFKGCTGLTSLVIGPEVQTIGNQAFEGCSQLTSATIRAKSISENAFKGCTGLTSLVIGPEVQTIGNNAFENCKSLTHVEIGSGVETIGSMAFAGCPLTSISVSSENENFSMATDVGDADVLLNNTNGKLNATCSNVVNTLVCGDLVIPADVTSIGAKAFINCSKLTSVVIPDSVTSIGLGAFSNCSGLTSVVIGSGVTSIGDQAFSGCYWLVSVVVPNSVTSIGKSAFSGCLVLTKVTIGSGVETIGDSAFSGCKWLASLIIGSGVTSIGGSAFSDCSKLTNIVIPDSVVSIGDQAFFKCSGLTSVVIGAGVETIGGQAFAGCRELTGVIISSVTPPQLGQDAFTGTPTDLKIYVPEDSVDTYKAAPGWKDYEKRIFATSILVDPVDPVDPETPTNNNLGIIIGASVGGAVVLTAAIAGTIIGIKKYNKNRK